MQKCHGDEDLVCANRTNHLSYEIIKKYCAQRTTPTRDSRHTSYVLHRKGLGHHHTDGKQPADAYRRHDTKQQQRSPCTGEKGRECTQRAKCCCHSEHHFPCPKGL